MTRHGRLIPLLCVASFSLPAAATAQDPPPPPDSVRPQQNNAPPPRPPRRRSDTIYRDQFQGRSMATAYDVIETLKNNWLIRRPSTSPPTNVVMGGGNDSMPSGGTTGSTSPRSQPTTMSVPSSSRERSLPGMDGGIQIYLDGSRMGGIEQLRTIPADMVMYIRRYDPNEAQARFGIGHTAGAIVVSTREEQP